MYRKRRLHCSEFMSKDNRVPLVSATGSTRMGKVVAQEVAQG